MFLQPEEINPAILQDVYRIFEVSFPASQKLQTTTLTDSFLAGKRRLFIARCGQAVAGFSVVLPLKHTKIQLLEYLAVDPGFRGAGIGSQLMRQVIKTARAQGDIPGMVIEVDPEDTQDPQERQKNTRRIAFYRRLNAANLACCPFYPAPDLAETGNVKRMRLLWLSVLESAAQPSGAEVIKTLQSIYTGSYGLRPDNPLIPAVANYVDLGRQG